ncbi:dCTP pyrophosphatase 1, partial [Cucurbita argyrosperma subsp. sororia]
MGGRTEEEGSVSLELLRLKMAEFAEERNWDRFHSPRNLLLALVGEVGELSEIFQWKGEVGKGLPEWAAEEKEHLGEELSDVLLYLKITLLELDQALLGNVKERSHGHTNVLELSWVNRMVSPTTTVATTKKQYDTTWESTERVLSWVKSHGRAFSDVEEVDYRANSK